jgi:[ribosomal protein S5]-alanine N-acetyltransferase
MQLIRPATPADLDELLALRVANRPYLERWEPDAQPTDRRYERAGVEEWLTRPHQFTIRDDGAIAGVVQLVNVDLEFWRSAMIGYWVDEARAGRGLATRAVAETLGYAFAELGLHRVEAGTHVDNLPSQRVLERTGFTLVGRMRKHIKIGGEWHDHLLWEILEDDPR